MNDDSTQFQIHANANDHGTYWSLRVSVSRVGPEGMEQEPVTWRKPSQIPRVDSDVDQAWAVLVTMAHMLEREGAVGRVAAGDWPGLW